MGCVRSLIWAALLALSFLALGPQIAQAVTGADGGSTTAKTPFSPMGRVTTIDGVGGGTRRVVGGRAYSAVTAADNLLASAGASAHVDFASTYSVPANTLKSGSHVKITGHVNLTDASGTDTFEAKVYLGSTTLTTTTAFDPDAAVDFVIFSCDLWSRADPSATSALVGSCRWLTEDGTTHLAGGSIMATTNFATNGALVIKASGKWSATTASTNARLEALDVEIL